MAYASTIVLHYYYGYYYCYNTSFIPYGKFGSPYLGKATQAARAVPPIPNNAHGIFMCSNKGMAANAWDL